MPANLLALLRAAFWAWELLIHCNTSFETLSSLLLDRLCLVLPVAAAPGSMASEASVVEQTTDGQVEEKKVIDHAKALEGENVCCHKETGGVAESDEPKVEQEVSPGAPTTNTEKAVEDEKDEAHTTEEVEECEDAKTPTSGVLQDKKDDMPVVVDVMEEIEDIKVSDSEVSANSKDVADSVKEKAETGKVSNFEVPEVENLKSDKGEKSNVTTESPSETVENTVVEPELSSVMELEQIGHETEVSEPVAEIAQTTEESSGIAADAALSSEKVEEKALTAVEPASDPTAEPEKKDEMHPANKELEVSKEEKVLTNDVEIPYEVSKVEPAAKENGNTSVSQVLDDDAVSEKIKEASDDNSAGGCEEETKNEVSGLRTTEGLVKELTVDPSLSNSSAVVAEAGESDNSLVTESAENVVKPEIRIESREEATLETEPVEEQQKEKTVKTEQKEKTVKAEAAEEQKGRKTLEAMLAEEQKGENNVETKLAEEQKEEKTLKAMSALIAADKTGDLSNPADEVTKPYVEEGKNSEGADKVAEEQRDAGGSDSAIKTIEIPTEKEKASEVVDKAKDGSATDNTNVAHTSRDIDPEGKKDVVDTSIKESVDKQVKTEKTYIADVEKDKTNDKKDDAEETDAQKLVESSKDDASSKTDVEAQKSGTPAKPKTLISKFKRSIVKVKKAIIGKSPSLKTISVESKEVSEVR